MPGIRRITLSLVLSFCCWPAVTVADQIANQDRVRAKQMLKQILGEVRKGYFDPTFGGRDLDAIERAVNDRIDKAASLGQALGLIAQALLDFNDSHLRFIPPARTTTVDYDWQLQMIGEECFVTAVRPGSDAARQSVAPGDRVLAIDGFPPRRSQLWKQLYNYTMLNPRPAVTLRLEQGGGQARDVTIQSTVKQGQRSLSLQDDLDVIVRDYLNASVLRQHRKVQVGRAVVWRMPDFDFEAHDVLKWALDDAGDLILDLRGNPGGSAETLSQVVGRLFDRNVTIARLQGRKPLKDLESRKSGTPFAGRIVVLVDSQTGSAAELLARVLQLENRGKVVGDRTSGAVRRAYYYDGKLGADRLVLFGATITDADVIMTDGRTLENTGVVPDELVLPTAMDLAAGRDPAMAKAASLLGLDLDAARAGGFFPVQWK